MRRLVCVAALLATVAAAGAECEFPYYPEFADRFEEYDEVTPLMAKRRVMYRPMLYGAPGDIVCEPLLLRTETGMPYGLYVAIYKGRNKKLVRKWNAVVETFNSSEKIPADELNDRLAFFFKEKVYEEFATLVVAPYTLMQTVRASHKGVPCALRGYESGYAKARQLLHSDEIYFKRVIAIGCFQVQIFEFENDRGDVVAIEVDQYSVATPADMASYSEDMRTYVGNLYEGIDVNAHLVKDSVNIWRKVLAAVPEEEAAKKYPRIREAEDGNNHP